MKKKYLVLVGLLIFVLLIVAFLYLYREERAKQAASELGIEYIDNKYPDRSKLLVSKICHPFWGDGSYRLVVENGKEETFYLMIKLNKQLEAIWYEDFTEDVRSGASVFPC